MMQNYLSPFEGSQPVMHAAPQQQPWYREPGYRPTNFLMDAAAKFIAQPIADAYTGLTQAAGLQQDPKAPDGYVSLEALNKGAQGIAEGALVGSAFTRAPIGALRSGAAGKSKVQPPPIPNTGNYLPDPNDNLGFYSGALRAAQGLKQAKGTPEQMLAQMKKGGAKQAEIEASGLNNFLDGNPYATRDGIAAFLELQQVPVREARYGSVSIAQAESDFENAVNLLMARNPDANRHSAADMLHAYIDNSNDDTKRLIDASRGLDPELNQALAKLEVSFEDTKWKQYSLDPNNPTYRETVLHLPPSKPGFDEWAVRARETSPHLSDAELRKKYEMVDPEVGPRDFTNGHFSEPNAISHLRTSMQPDAEGKQNFVINELQSDWGQKIRDSGGARDEAKIAELKRRFDASENNLAELPPDRRPPELVSENHRLLAELRTAEGSAPGHPLVNSTDQWVNTSLRRGLNQAITDKADYISIPSGETVDSFGMGAPLKGLQYAYNEMYPKKLRDIIKKIDKDAAKPEMVVHMASHDAPSVGGGRDSTLGNGFTRFPITDKMRQHVQQHGLPLFSNPFTGGFAPTYAAPQDNRYRNHLGRVY